MTLARNVASGTHCEYYTNKIFFRKQVLSQKRMSQSTFQAQDENLGPAEDSRNFAPDFHRNRPSPISSICEMQFRVLKQIGIVCLGN